MDVGEFIGDPGVFGTASASGSFAGGGVVGRGLEEGALLEEPEEVIVVTFIHLLFIDAA